MLLGARFDEGNMGVSALSSGAIRGPALAIDSLDEDAGE
jgi:hypothetical protein